MPAEGWAKLSEEEVRLAQKWHKEKLCPREIADRLGRDKSVIYRLIAKKFQLTGQGRPALLSDEKVDSLERHLDTMIRKANAKHVVTAAMLKRATKLKASVRTIQKALHKRNIRFRPLREKPVLTDDDIAARLKFAKTYRSKSKAWWNQNIHAFIDGKHFQVYLNANARSRAAQHATKGAYRSPGKGLSRGYVKPSTRQKFNTGAKSTLVVAGVGAGRVSMWHYVPDGRWSGNAAANMYKGSLKRALDKTWPAKRKFNVLEDNDPTGFKSRKGIQAKVDSKIVPFAIPPRSPDLSLCDYALWKEVNKRMRLQEKSWAKGKTETREGYMERLRRTALRLPKHFITDSIGDMRRGCQRLYEAKGSFFEEGGR